MIVVAFEGFDGVGKTTTAFGLAKVVDGFVATAGDLLDDRDESWRRERRAVNEAHDIDARFHYFVKLNQAQMRLSRTVNRASRVAILESSIYRTVATHRALGSAAAHSFHIGPELQPDHTFYLELSESTRQERMIGRDGDLVHTSHWDETLFERREELGAEYGAFGLPTMDAAASLDDIVEQVRSSICL